MIWRSTFIAIWSIGTWPGPSTITWTSFSHARFVSSPRVSSSANCARSLASWMEPGRSESPSEMVTSYWRRMSRNSTLRCPASTMYSTAEATSPEASLPERPDLEAAAALDPALWFYGKWGCTFCERAGRRLA